MPSPNVVKINVAESYYHVYARGVDKQTIFRDAFDFEYFQSLLMRYLSLKPYLSKEGTYYPHFAGSIELLCYCLMNNHFHLLIYQLEECSMSRLMRSLMVSYSRYFNLKYKRSGPLFESRYKASRIENDSHLEHMSRYIHMNPRYWKRYLYSSLNQYMSNELPEWINPQRVLMIYPTRRAYYETLLAYEDQKKLLKEIKHELAC